MNYNTFATRSIVHVGVIETVGYLLPESLWTETNKFGVSKTQAVILAYPGFDRNNAAAKYNQLVRSKKAQIVAPYGLPVHANVPTDSGAADAARVDLLPADYLVVFLKIAKKLGSKPADDLIDALAGLSIQQLFSDAFELNMTAQDRQNFLLEWHIVREYARGVHSGFKNACYEKLHPGNLVHDYMTVLIFGDTAEAARMKALVDSNDPPEIGLNHQEDIKGMRLLAKAKVKYTNKKTGTWQQQVEWAVRAATKA